MSDGGADGNEGEGGGGDGGGDGDATAIEPADHALARSDPQYPEFTFEEGTIEADGGFDLRRELDREEMRAWLSDVTGALESHDFGVEAPDRRVTLGVAPKAAVFSFDPDENHSGELEVTFQLRAKVMVVNESDDPKVGARGGKGFIPLAMLTDEDDREYRCYNWIEDPTDG